MIDWAARNAEDPEALMRLVVIRNRCTNRDLDAIAQGKYPEANDLWPGEDDHEYLVGLWHGDPPEFYRAQFDYSGLMECNYTTWLAGEAVKQKRRTHCALAEYVSRTGDWDTVRRILK